MSSSRLATRDSVSLYLQSISRVPLLTHEQEIEFGRRVQAMNGLNLIQAKLAESLGHEPSHRDWAIAAQLSPDELQTALDQGHKAKRKMVEANLRLVVSIAKKYSKSNVDLLDLIQDGTLGLQRGVEKFDPSKGYRFSTYAYWWIRQGITRSIAEKSRAIRLPIHITEKLNKLKRAQRELSQRLGKTPTTVDLATELDMTPQQVRDYLSMMRQPLSLDMPVGENSETSLSDLLEDNEHTPDRFLARHSLTSDLERVVGTLNDRQQRVIRLRYGLETDQAMTLAQVGRILNISRERVRQIEREALFILRKQGAQLQSYLVS